MSTTIYNVHDKFFKETFLHKETVQSFLERYIPPEMASVLDLGTLQERPESFIGKDLKEYFSDKLYRVQLKTGKEDESIFVYILFEHKSYVHKNTAFQMLHYMVKIWEKQESQHEEFTVILPIVFYQGKEPWTAPMSMQEMIKTQVPEMKKLIPGSEYILFSLSALSQEEIQGEPLLKFYLRLLWEIQHGIDYKRLEEIYSILKETPSRDVSKDFNKALIIYLLHATEINKEDLQEFINKTPVKKEITMASLAQEWRQEGILEGERKGKKEGLWSGIETILEIKFGESGLKLMSKFLRIEDINILDKLRLSLKRTQTVDDVEVLLQKYLGPSLQAG